VGSTEQNTLEEALVLPCTDGTIYFYILNKLNNEQQSFKFDFEVRIKAVRVGYLRLFGRSQEATKCLFVFTYEDYTFVFYDFVFEVNTQHVTFKKEMRTKVAKKNIVNPVL